jgi:hypothetical protein
VYHQQFPFGVNAMNTAVRQRARHLPNHSGLIEHMLDRCHVEGHKIVVDRAKFLGGIDPQLNSMGVRYAAMRHGSSRE